MVSTQPGDYWNKLVIDEIRNNTSSHNFLSTVVKQNSSSCVKIPLRCSPSWVETTNEIAKTCLFFFLSYCLRDGLVTSNYFGEGNLSRTSFYVVTLVREKTDTIPTERNLVFDCSIPSTIIYTENVQDTWVRVCGSRVCRRTQIGMFRPIRMDHTNCLQVVIKNPSSFRTSLSDNTRSGKGSVILT